MKKFYTLLLFLLLIGCGGNKDSSDKKSNTTPQESENIEDKDTEAENEKSENTESMEKEEYSTNKNEASLSDIKKRPDYVTKYQKNLEEKMTHIEEEFAGLPENEESVGTINEFWAMWDVELNKAYKRVMGKLNEKQKIELRNEQKKWLKEMDDGMDYKAYYDNAARLYEMTRDRTYYLVELDGKIDSEN